METEALNDTTTHERRFHGAADRLRAADRIARLDVPRVVELSLAGLIATSVLDVGTGTGAFAEAFVAAGLVVTGIDTNADLLAVAREFAPAAQFKEAPAEQIPFRDGSFDLVFLGHVLHEADEPLAALREARRVMRQRVAILEWPYREEPHGPPLAHRISPATVAELAARAGLSHVETIHLEHIRTLDLGQILAGALDTVLGVNQVKLGYIFLVEKGAQDLVLAAHRGVSAELAEEYKRLRLGESLSGRVAQTGKSCVVNDLLQDQELMPSLAGKAGMRSFVAIPLMSRDRGVGVLNLADPQIGRFSYQDVECLTSAGTGIGVAIENAYLYQSMRYYVGQITLAQEKERARIARELHDDTLQSLIVLSRQLGTLTKTEAVTSPTTAQRLRELQTIADDVIQGVRRFSRDLRPSTLDDLGLLPTLEGLATTLTKKDGVHAHLEVTGEKRRLPPEVELALFRIAQEALNNVKKHAEASEVMIAVAFTDDTVTMSVQDNGKGFTLATPADDLAASGHLGLIGMHERSRLLGGTLVIEPRLNLGTKVVVTVRIYKDPKSFVNP